MAINLEKISEIKDSIDDGKHGILNGIVLEVQGLDPDERNLLVEEYGGIYKIEIKRIISYKNPELRQYSLALSKKKE